MDSLKLEKRLLDAFSDCQAAVIDRTGSGSNFELRLSTPDLMELSRVKCHQTIMELFKEELSSGEIHALTIKYIKI